MTTLFEVKLQTRVVQVAVLLQRNLHYAPFCGKISE